MSYVAITVEHDGKGMYELCVGEYEGDTRLEHVDHVLSREDLWKLKQEVDRAWFEQVLSE